ncbi:hypothetical protein S40293_02908 [Stachybotrys chartarum IBT 40293]|nr:hypothetical protein S40293_02908 [Stachybotrys chartarum IBT 40293]
MEETWLQAYARTSVFTILSRIEQGRLTLICKYLSQKDHTHVYGKASDDGLEATVVFNSPRVWDRICRGFDLGVAESYMMQELECDDLLGLFSIYLANQKVLGFSGGGWLHQLIPRLTYLLSGTSNDIDHARKNASFHYDTSNDHFASFLSPDMNYSSALWSADPGETLHTAQRRKVHNIIDQARITSSDHVLDIGCGWGDLAMEAVKRTGCRVTGLTLSAEQKRLAEKRVEEAGLEKQIEILLCDYRHAPRPDTGYDCVVSVEMLEHVGDKYMKQYFTSISRLLNPAGGRMVVQGITILNSVGHVSRFTPQSNGKKSNVGAFLDRYIFPGGYLPTINQLLTCIHTGSKGTLEVDHVQNIGTHYIKTLQYWRENFQGNWEIIRASFLTKNSTATEDEIEHFRRRWVYYFTYCEAGFRARLLGDYVISAVMTPDVVITGDVKY